MTKKDYELIASNFKEQHEALETKFPQESPELNASLWVLHKLAEMLSFDLIQHNERFDRKKFLKACGVES